jgi:NADPH:quinone reductase
MSPMRVVEFEQFGPPDVLRVADRPMPEVGPGMIRVRVAAAAVNPADYKWRRGVFREMAPVPLPHVLGYDIAGTVHAVGEDVDGLRLGDRVFAMLNSITKGGYAEYVVLPAADAAPIPAPMDIATAAALPTAALTGVQLIEDHVRPTAGETVLITGATGNVGRFAVHAALRLGVKVVAAVRANQAEGARALGASDVVILGEQDWTGTPFDHVADTVGGAEVATLCRQLLPGGRIRTVATVPIDPEGLQSEPQFIAVRNDRDRLGQIGEIVASGAVRVRVAHRLPLDAAPEAHRLLEAGGVAGKIILEP